MSRCAARILALCIVLAPSLCSAQQDGPSIVGYGLRGFGSGIGLGLATGYLATGSKFESGEWKTVVFGAAVGGLTGMGVGILLGVVDASAAPARYGHYMLQDMSLGITLGLLAGATVGALIWLDDGRAKDVLIGLSGGVLIGAGVGLILGVIEGALRKPDQEPVKDPAKLSFNIGFTPGRGGVPLPYPSLLAHF